MKILAIETSCDDTGIAILEIGGTKNAPSFNVLANVVASQIEIHRQYGGVYPFAAKREHEKNLEPSFREALKLAKITEKEIDLIVVTNGPGLEPCLWVGVNFAKDLAKKWNVPLVPVNHIESHILVNFLENKNIKFPAVCLVVSGGHTQIILMKGIGKYKILGETRDDAAGECFDKAAKILGLGYPGGPAISKIALKWKLKAPITNNQTNSKSQMNPTGSKQPNFKLPRPMIGTKDYDFSFSGLKTAILYHHRKQPKKIQKSKKYIEEMCVEIQQAIIDVLLKKTIKAAKDYKAKTIILGGGVSANSELRKQFKQAIENKLVGFLSIDKKPTTVNFLVPPANLSTDNAVMTAITSYFHRNQRIGESDLQKLSAYANLRIG